MNVEQNPLAAEIDLMRDVYMSRAQREAYERILARAFEQREPGLCGCGKPAEYMTVGGGWCCNKYGIKCRPEQPRDNGPCHQCGDAGMVDYDAEGFAVGMVPCPRCPPQQPADKAEQPEGREAVAEPANGREVVAEMVRRFLSWRVPPDFAPDGGISFTPHPYPECWPIGTNLLTEQQAKAMFLQCLPAIAFECMEWKDRALSAEKTIERMADEFNRENGLTFMGEPLILTTPPAKVPEGREAVACGAVAALQLHSCWLAELFLPMGGNSLGRYHTGFTDISGRSRTTNNPHEAKKYDTKEKAETAIAALGSPMMGEWKAISHGFYKDTTTPPAKVPEDAAAEVLRRVANDPDGLLVLARLAKAETGRLHEQFAAMLAAAQQPKEGCDG